jgi:N-acetylglutamate synthase-like GNAT family acetyltransferase
MSSSIEQEEEPGTTYPLLVREASQADIRAISELLGHAFAEFEALYTPQAYVATVLPIDGVRNRLNEGPVWVAERESAVIGTVGAISASNALMVRGMAVHPVARGLGVAKRLLHEVEEFARQNGYKQLSLFTTPFLSQAIPMYQAAGFCFTGETVNPHGTNLLHMVKCLDIESSDHEASES